MGYMGFGGFELYVDVDKIGVIWDVVMEVGKFYGIQFVGLGVCDILCLEMGYCLYGNDFIDEISFFEVGFGWIIKFKKGDFIGCDVLLV